MDCGPMRFACEKPYSYLILLSNSHFVINLVFSVINNLIYKSYIIGNYSAVFMYSLVL